MSPGRDQAPGCGQGKAAAVANSGDRCIVPRPARHRPARQASMTESVQTADHQRRKLAPSCRSRRRRQASCGLTTLGHGLRARGERISSNRRMVLPLAPVDACARKQLEARHGGLAPAASALDPGGAHGYLAVSTLCVERIGPSATCTRRVGEANRSRLVRHMNASREVRLVAEAAAREEVQERGADARSDVPVKTHRSGRVVDPAATARMGRHRRPPAQAESEVEPAETDSGAPTGAPGGPTTRPRIHRRWLGGSASWRANRLLNGSARVKTSD